MDEVLTPSSSSLSSLCCKTQFNISTVQLSSLWNNNPANQHCRISLKMMTSSISQFRKHFPVPLQWILTMTQSCLNVAFMCIHTQNVLIFVHTVLDLKSSFLCGNVGMFLCVHMCVHAEVRSCLPQLFPTLFFKSLTETGAHQFG